MGAAQEPPDRRGDGRGRAGGVGGGAGLLSEGSVVEALLAWARSTAAVRAVLLTGSRAATQPAHLDGLSDYDVLVFVDEPERLAPRPEWVGWYGPVLVRYRERRSEDGFPMLADLVLYEDGTKIDYTVKPVAALEAMAASGGLPEALDAGYGVLFDPDGLASRLPPPTGEAYRIGPPAREQYEALVEELWWESFYVAKNLVRDELLPARYSLDCVMKLDLLRRMLEWRAGVASGWRAKAGAYGRGLRDHLDADTRQALEATYRGASVEDGWDALFATCRLFGQVAREVGAALGHPYPERLERRATARLEALREGGGGS